MELVVEETGRVAYKDKTTEMLFGVESLPNIRKLKLIFALWEFATHRYEIPFTPLVLFSLPRNLNLNEILPVLCELGKRGIQLIITVDCTFFPKSDLLDNSECGYYEYNKKNPQIIWTD